MMTRRITDDGLTLWYEEVAGSGVWCGLRAVLMTTAELLSRVVLIPKLDVKLVWIFQSFVLQTIHRHPTAAQNMVYSYP